MGIPLIAAWVRKSPATALAQAADHARPGAGPQLEFHPTLSPAITSQDLKITYAEAPDASSALRVYACRKLERLVLFGPVFQEE